VTYTKAFATVIITSACHRWNKKEDTDRTWNNLKIHVAAAYRQHKQMQGESVTTSGYHATNAAVAQTENVMDEATIGDLANLATETSSYHGVVAVLTEANARWARYLEKRSKESKEIKTFFSRRSAQGADRSPLRWTIIAGHMDTK
jgi:hypothetical protein